MKNFWKSLERCAALAVAATVFSPPCDAARTILSENFQDEAPDTRPAGTFYARSLVPFVNPATEPAKVVVTGGSLADPFGAGNKSLAFHNPNSAAQMALTWTAPFDNDPAVFRNGTIDFDLWMDKPPTDKFWSFFDIRIGFGDESRSGVSTVNDVTIWDNMRIQNVGQANPVESVVDAGAKFTVGLETTYTDPDPGLMGPDKSFHVRIEIDGTPGNEHYTFKLTDTAITWFQDMEMTHPWVPGAPGVNILSFLTDASAFFAGGASNVYLDNLVVVNNDLSPLGNGDYNGDGHVDGADFTAWQRTLGSSVTAGTGADGNGNGTVDGPDLDLWKMKYGTLATATANSVPEPSAALMILAGALSTAFRQRRK